MQFTLPDENAMFRSSLTYFRVSENTEQYYSRSSCGNLASLSAVFVVLPAMFWNLQIAVDFISTPPILRETLVEKNLPLLIS